MAVTVRLVAAVLLSAAGVATQTCKAVPGSDAWPSVDAWNAFNETLGGRLIAPTPPAAVCHPDRDEYNEEACKTLTEAWVGHEFHTLNPVSTLWNNWNNDTCLPDPTAPCSGAGYPAFVVNATEGSHVQLAVNFARENNIRLVVKNTGHDFAGRSVAPNALSIWTHHLDHRSWDDTSFTPKGCDASAKTESATITVGPGNQLFDLYEWTDSFNHTLVAGNGKTVGVGGYYTGGGHSILSGTYGLGVDQILEYELVTPQGEIVAVNECQNQDLFFALRGAGGSTFGVVTSVTMKIYPTPKMATLLWKIFAPANSSEAIDIGGYVYSKLGEFTDQGLNGYMFSQLAGFDPLDFDAGLVGGTYGILTDVGSEDVAHIEEAFAPLAAEAKRRWGCDKVMVWTDTVVYQSMLEFISVWHDKTTSGADRYTDAAIVSSGDMAANPEKIELANRRAVARGVGSVFGAMALGGPGLHNAQPRGGRTAVHPAWRTTSSLLYVTQDFKPFDESSRQKTIEILQDAIAPLREMPQTGAYVNEAVIFHDDWQHLFWGDLYEELVDIKRRVDPDDVFWCGPCVGSERWHEVDGVLCRI